MDKQQLPHDKIYKALFENRAVIKSLLREFVPGDFTNGMDFASLKLCPDSHITPDMRARLNDLVWRVSCQGKLCYIYIMLEFQSRQEQYMALRILTYTSLLWEDLLKTEVIEYGGKLPPVLPIVLYNGDTPWKASLNLKNLIMPVHAELDTLQPSFSCLLIDEKHIPLEILARARGEAAYVFRVEQAKNEKQIVDIALEMDSTPKDPEFFSHKETMWKFMDMKIRHLVAKDADDVFGHENEEINMLAELIEKYKKPYVDEGYALGLSVGEARGKAIGEAIGETRGIKSIIHVFLKEKFGVLPERWEAALAEIDDPAKARSLFFSINNCASKNEVQTVLDNLR